MEEYTHTHIEKEVEREYREGQRESEEVSSISKIKW